MRLDREFNQEAATRSDGAESQESELTTEETELTTVLAAGKTIEEHWASLIEPLQTTEMKRQEKLLGIVIVWE